MSLIQQTGFPIDSTSAGSPMLGRLNREPRLVGLMLAGLFTTALTAISPELAERSAAAHSQTSSGVPISDARIAGADIGELRRRSGLTWDQLARLFGVTRRSLHFWASGKPLTPANEEHLHRVLAVIRAIDRGSASANRMALLTAQDDGQIPFDLLVAAQYDRALALAGPGSIQARPKVTPLSQSARAMRLPLPSEELGDALHDRVHTEVGEARLAKSVKVPG